MDRAGTASKHGHQEISKKNVYLEESVSSKSQNNAASLTQNKLTTCLTKLCMHDSTRFNPHHASVSCEVRDEEKSCLHPVTKCKLVATEQQPQQQKRAPTMSGIVAVLGSEYSNEKSINTRSKIGKNCFSWSKEQFRDFASKATDWAGRRGKRVEVGLV